MPTQIDKVEEGLPISVIIPTLIHRREFLDAHVMPMIENNEPIEIIKVINEGSAPHQRNLGFKKSTQKYVIFWDDDCVMPSNFLRTLYNTLEKNNEVDYAYTGYIGIARNPNIEPNNNFIIEGQKFNPVELRRYNYISTMSLIRREAFIGFDENLKRFQDWSLWLSMLELGKRGEFVPNLKFMAFFNDVGITSNSVSQVDAYNAIRIKHKL